MHDGRAESRTVSPRGPMRLPRPGTYDGPVTQPSSARDVVAALSDRTRRRAADPLLTWYDVASGARVEFSTRTFANWVDKTVNLLDELELVGEPVANTLLVTHPLHWVTMVTTMAVWQSGGTVLATGTPTDRATGAIVGPEAISGPGTTIACSLHPLGAGLAEAPEGVIDFAEVLSQPDVHQWFPPASPLCLVDASEHAWSEAGQVEASDARVLIDKAGSPWELVRSALMAPLLGDGSVVLVTNGTPESVEDICRQERAIHA